MLFEKIDRNSWKRNEYFEHYFANTPCTYSMTVKLDITPIKKKQLKLYPAMLYINFILKNYKTSALRRRVKTYPRRTRRSPT